MQADILYVVIQFTVVLVGAIVFFLFLVYRFRGEDQLKLKVKGAGLDPTRRGAWYAQHVTRTRNVLVYTLIEIASALVSTFLLLWILLPSAFYSLV